MSRSYRRATGIEQTTISIRGSILSDHSYIHLPLGSKIIFCERTTSHVSLLGRLLDRDIEVEDVNWKANRCASVWDL
jgi:hypothetical protein